MFNGKDFKNTKKPIVEFRSRRFAPVSKDKHSLSQEEQSKKEEALKRFSLVKEKTDQQTVDVSDPETRKRAAFFGDKKLLEQIKSHHTNNSPRPPYHHHYRNQGQGAQGGQDQKRPYFPRPDSKWGDNRRPYSPTGAPKFGDRPPRPFTPVGAPNAPKPFISNKPKPFVIPEAPKPIATRDKKPTVKKYQKPKKKIGTTTAPSNTHKIVGNIYHDEYLLENDKTRSLAMMKRAREKAKNSLKRVMPKFVTVFEGMSLTSLAAAMSVTCKEIIDKLQEIGVSTTKDEKLDIEVSSFVVTEFGSTPKKRAEVLDKVVIDSGDETDKKYRAPVVTVVGHVDHGKTSLLDALRKTQVTAKESGGITQSIGASQVFNKDGKFITFVDTPGHAVFTEMRARGINITDIVLLIIAADDGIKEQTIESIQHAKASGAFIIVVITKIDKPGTSTDKIRNMLFNYNIAVESLGGDVPDIEVSAKTGHNLPELIETILLHAELLELKAPVNSKAYGIVLESYLDKHKGPIANIIIKSGTLKKSDYFLTGSVHGKVKSITDWQGRQINEALPSYPVQIMGLSKTVSSGSDFIVMSESDAKEVAAKRMDIEGAGGTTDGMRLYSVMDLWRELAGIKEDKVDNFIIKADSYGSSEAIAVSLAKIRVENISTAILLKGVGAVTESDLMLAKASNACIIAFKVDIPASIKKSAEFNKVKVKHYDIIYKILEDAENSMKDVLAPSEEVVELGRAEIREIFVKHKVGTIAGCVVVDGVMKTGASASIIRDGIEIYTSKIDNLRQLRDDRREVKAGQECGIMLANFNDYKMRDVIKCFETRKIKEDQLQK